MDYKVLWIDDKPNDDFIDDALDDYNLDIVNKKDYISGITWLKNNRNICSAVILDVNCLEGDGTPETASKQVFDDNLQEIISICCNPDKPLVPWFVYTAGDFDGVETLNTQISAKRYWDDRKYYKKPIDREDLLKNIQKAIGLSPLFQYVKQYSDVLEVFPDKESTLCLLRIMDVVHKNDTTNSSAYNDIRKILEAVTKILKAKGLFPDDQDGLSAASYYIKCISINSRQSIVPSYISFCFTACENICNDGSHDGKQTPMRVDEDTAKNKAPYLIRSAFYMLCDIIIWAKSLLSDDNDIALLKEKVRNLNISKFTKNR